MIGLFVSILQILACLSASPQSYDVVSVDELSLNRAGVQLSASELSKFPNAALGFRWNDGDNGTNKWRPQGITGILTTKSSNSSVEFIAVTWYGRDDAGYANRGVRISFVDVSELKESSNVAPMYRHVLLVDEDYHTFEGMHAGGLALVGDELHVPDSRSGTKEVHTFSTAHILAVPESEQDEFYGYAYLLPRVATYTVPITPSFLSNDHESGQLLLGTFSQCSSYHQDTVECLADTKDRLAWYTPGEVNATSPSCAPFFSEMQGAARASVEAESVLWTSSSYGSGHESHLHAMTWPLEAACGGDDVDKTTFRSVTYPPGLEDLHVAEPGSGFAGSLWMVTEFGSCEGSGNTRTVVATPMEHLLP